MGMRKLCETSVGQTTWFLAENGNVLCQEINGMIICKAVFPNPYKKMELYNAIYEFHEKLFLVPFLADHILVFNIRSLDYYFIENDELALWRDYDYKYSASYRQDNFLYLFGRWIPYIVKIDMDTDTIVLISHLDGKEIESYKEIKREIYFADNYSIDANTIWIPTRGAKILAYHLENDLIQLHKLEMGACAICRAANGFFWLYSVRGNAIMKWNPEDGITEVIEQINLHSEFGEVVLEYDNNVLRCKSRIEIICIDIQTKERAVERISPKESFFVCNEWEDEAAYEYLNEKNEQLFTERSYNYLGNPTSAFLKYVKRKNRKGCLEQDYSRRNVGSNIYSYMKNILI